MKDYFLFLRLLVLNGLRGTSAKRGKMSQGAIIALCCLPLEAILCVSMHFLTKVCVGQDVVAELVNMVMTATQIVVFYFVIQSIINVLYMSDDTPFISSLPLRPSAVFFARLTKVYLSELIIAAYLLVPLLLTISITAASMGYAVSPAFYPLIIVLVMATPVLPLVIASLLSLPLMWLASFFKKRAAFSTVALILLFTVMFTAYFLIMPNLGKVSDLETLAPNIIGFFRSFHNVMYPNKVLIEMSLGHDALLNFALSCAIWLGAVAVVVCLSAAFYKRATSAGLETGGSAGRGKAEVKSHKHIVFSLMICDFKSLMRYPSLAVSSCINVLLAPILTCVMFVFYNQSPDPALSNPLITVGLLFMYSVVLCGGTNNAASLAFTREGKSFFISQHLPVSAKQAVLAKFLLASAFSLVAIIALFVIIAVITNVGIINAVLYALLMAVVCTGLNALSIYSDMKRPILDWKNTTDIQKNNFRVIIPALIGFAVGGGVLLLAIGLSMLTAKTGLTALFATFWSISFAVCIAFGFAFCYILYDRSDKLYAELAENAERNSRSRSFSGIGKSRFGRGGNGGLLGGNDKGGMLK